MKKKHCVWKEQEISMWKTKCGRNVFSQDETRPYDQGYRYCMYCGRPIEEIAFHEDDKE